MDSNKIKKVRVESLEPNTRLTDDILSAKQTILLRSGTILKKEFIKKLSDWGIKHIYTYSDQFESEKEFADGAESVIEFLAENKQLFVERTHLYPLLDDKQLSEYAQATENAFTELLKKDMANLGPAFTIVEKLLNSLNPLKERILKITAEIPQAKYLMYHAVSSTMLFAAVLRDEGMAEERVTQLSVGALTRDVGQMLLPAAILDKPGQLTPGEFDEVKKHPSNSATILNRSATLKNDALMLVLQHHERWDGKGYPNGFEGNELLAETQLLSVCDAYQATTNLISMSGKQFSQLSINRFITRFGLYPVGTFVKLSDNTYAIVTRINEGKPTHPEVRVILDDSMAEVADAPHIDLSKNQRIFIVKVYKT
jgi:HD-GYP domain-containing protein (c-di-GMP phosphodiesterase class II)